MSTSTTPVTSIKGYERQARLEQEARALALGRFNGDAWQLGAINLSAKLTGDKFANAFADMVADADRQPGYMADVLHAIGSRATAQSVALDAMIYILSRASEGHDRADLARRVGIRAECAVLLGHPRLQGSWHRDAVLKLACSNAGITDLRYRLRNMDLLRNVRPFTEKGKAALGLLLVDLMVGTGMVQYENRRALTGWFQYVVMSNEYRNYVDNWRKTAMASVVGRWPMVCPPAQWTDATNGGYFTQQEELMTGGWVTFEKAAADCRDHVLGVLNKLQAQPVSINRKLLAVLHDTWELGLEVGTLPPRHPLPELDSTEWVGWRRKTTEFWRRLIEIKQDKGLNSARAITARSIALFERLMEEPKLYRPVHTDSRGRVYYRSNLSLHQADHLRAVVQWPESHQDNRLTESTKPWLAWQLRGYMGLTQTTLQEAADWFDTNRYDLVQLGRAVRQDILEVRESKQPWSAAALLMEVAEQHANPHHNFRHPFRLDQTASGYGHIAALTWDHRLAELTNLTGTTKRDLYSEIMLLTNRLLEELLVSETDERRLRALELLRTYGVDRALVKDCCMPLVYGGQKYSMRNKLHANYRALVGNVVGEDGIRPGDLSSTMQHIMWRAAHEVLPQMANLSAWLKTMAGRQLDAGMVPHWWTPDGMRIESYRQNGIPERIELFARGGRKMSCGVYVRRDDGQPIIVRKKTLTGITPDFVNSMDACFLRMAASTWDAGPLEVVHDCFATDLGAVDGLNEHLRSTWQQMYGGDWLAEMKGRVEDELGGEELPDLPNVDGAPPEDMGCNPYLFC